MRQPARDCPPVPDSLPAPVNILLSTTGIAVIVLGRFDKRTLEFASDSSSVEPQCGDPGIPVNE